MPSVRSAAPLLIPICVIPLCVLTVALGACSTALRALAPRSVDLSGEWQLDLSLSDYPQEAVAAGAIGGGATGNSTGGRGRGRRGMGAAGAMGGAGGAGSPAHRFAMPPHLRLVQSGGNLVVHITMPDGKTATNQYLAGEASVVSTNRGPANRTTGWRHKSFVIATQVGEKGPESVVEYFIDNDHMLEVVTTQSNGGSYKFQYTLVYDHATS